MHTAAESLDKQKPKQTILDHIEIQPGTKDFEETKKVAAPSEWDQLPTQGKEDQRGVSSKRKKKHV